MTKNRKITKQQYVRAQRIVSEYEAQTSLSFSRGCFSIDDLTLSVGSITVEKLTEIVFSDDDCHMLDRLITEKIKGLEWCNVNDLGYLSISFYRTTEITDEHINVVLECLNAL